MVERTKSPRPRSQARWDTLYLYFTCFHVSYYQDTLYSDYATDDPLMEVLMANDLTMMAGMAAEVSSGPI